MSLFSVLHPQQAAWQLLSTWPGPSGPRASGMMWSIVGLSEWTPPPASLVYLGSSCIPQSWHLQPSRSRIFWRLTGV